MAIKEETTCLICQEIVPEGPHYEFMMHVRQHGYKSKEYYDLFIKKPNEGKCGKCQNPTSYRWSKGYMKYCVHCSDRGIWTEERRLIASNCVKETKPWNFVKNQKSPQKSISAKSDIKEMDSNQVWAV